MAVKKSTTKRVVKKASKKAPAKKKAVTKKSLAKKSTAKKRVAKKAVAKKSVAKKSAVKKTAKRTTKKVAKKSSISTFVVPPVPRAGMSTSSRVNVSTTPAPAKPSAPAKPIVAPKQGTSKTVLGAVVVGVILLAIIVWSQSGSKNDDGAMPTPPASVEATPEASTEPTTEETAAPVAAVEAPSKFVALNSADGLTLRWIAPTATDGLTGYNVEIRANGKGDWNVIATVPADQLTQSVIKSDTSGWTQFRVTSVYSDGQSASATVFGIPGVFA